MVLLSALFALGVALTGTTGVSATIGIGINNVANASSLLNQVRYVCHKEQVCRVSEFGGQTPICVWQKVCRETDPRTR
jgi:hypothetical protein